MAILSPTRNLAVAAILAPVSEISASSVLTRAPLARTATPCVDRRRAAARRLFTSSVTSRRKLSTASASFFAEDDKLPVASVTRLASELVSPMTPATFSTLFEATAELSDALEMARAISFVASLCCSTAIATAFASVSISATAAVIDLISPTALLVAPWIAAIWAAMSSVAVAVCPASVLTSKATTAKPLPASPARAASIVAFKASKLVC